MTRDERAAAAYIVGVLLAVIAAVTAPAWSGPLVLGVLVWLIH